MSFIIIIIIIIIILGSPVASVFSRNDNWDLQVDPLTHLNQRCFHEILLTIYFSK